ncbi:MAG: GNAT family N-acetyltransferase [Eubacteriaceae bacterium]|nr:GNAT family N-acetyltransferase [Eubacteriaceae bacterium]
MPIPGTQQPEIIQIDDTLRLRRFDNVYDFALDWYLDGDTTYLVDGDPVPYSRYTLDRMYSYLDGYGELYFIEYLTDGEYVPIGDVTFCCDDLPIVIGPKEMRGRGIGKKVILALCERARQLGYETLGVKEIYDFNTASIACFTSCGFTESGRTEKGHSYILYL